MSNIILKISLIIVLLAPSLASAHIQEGLVGWWRFDEASGNAIDSSGQGNVGTPTGTLIIPNCKRSGCRQFDGSSDYVDLGNVIISTDDLSVSFWFYAYSISNTQALVYFCSDTADCMDVGLFASRVYASPAYSVGNTRRSNVLTSSNWYHVVVIKSAGLMTSIYIDGIDQAIASAHTWVPPSTTSRIGGTPQAGVNSLGGFLDDVRVYNRALSAQEVMDLYKPGSVIYGAVISGAKINQ